MATFSKEYLSTSALGEPTLSTSTTATSTRQGNILLRKNGAGINKPSSRQATRTIAGGSDPAAICSRVDSSIFLYHFFFTR